MKVVVKIKIDWDKIEKRKVIVHGAEEKTSVEVGMMLLK